ncbi:MAG: transglycosylase domain-containing protein [Bacteroidota bacterium]|nr:transglycosylase domain-containing protein [Bacteroidota bacterium]
MTEPVKKSFRKYVIIFWSLFLILLTTVVLFFVAIANGTFGHMPTFEELENPKNNLASEIYSADQVLLGKYYYENRTNTHYSNLSPHLTNALISTEDVRFNEHSGIDVKSLLRVAYGVFTGNHKGGGSTITQQLAKNLFPRDFNLSTTDLVLRKFKEWVTAVKLERNYSKTEIMAMYFNTVAFGSQSFGIKAASLTFFNKEPKELKIEEAALLVGVVNAPTRYSPILNPENSIKRRNIVLNQMAKYGNISETLKDSLVQIPLDMSSYGIISHRTGIAKYFREYLRTHLKKWCKSHTKANGKPYNLYSDGLKIYTTINSKMQKHAEAAVKNHLGNDLQPSFDKHWEGYTTAPFDFENDSLGEKADAVILSGIKRSERYRKMRQNKYPEKDILNVFHQPTAMSIFSWQGDIDTIMTPWDSVRYYKSILQTGLMSVEPNTGFVRAYVGGANYEHFKYDHVTYGKRQVGSTFKPFLYTLAMQSGQFSPCTKLPNVQTRIELDDGTFWSPENSSSSKIGEMVSLKWALAHSNNWISAYLIKRFSPQSVIKIAQQMGITSKIPSVYSIALGTPDISLYEMVGALNTFANKGIYMEPIFITRIEDKHGNVIERFIPEQHEALSEETAYLMIELLKGVVKHGTGRRLGWKYGLHNPIAGKTGTTQNQSDGWFMGLTPDLVTGVWVGCEDRAAHFRTIRLGQGANMALPIWALYIQSIYNDSTMYLSKRDFDKPSAPLHVEIDCDNWDKQNTQQQNNIDENEF